MRATLDIDEDILRYLNEQAKDTGRSTGEIASGLMRDALSGPDKKRIRSGIPVFTWPEDSDAVVTTELVDELRDQPERLLLRNGFPQLHLQPGIEVTLDSITGILDAIEADDELGAPLAIDDEMRAAIKAYSKEGNAPPGKVAARLLQESLLKRNEWPMRNGIPQIPSRNRRIITTEFVKQLQDELD